MSQRRKPRGVRATQEGRQKLQQAKAAGRDEDGNPLTYERIAEKAKVDKKTVERFFRGEAKDRDSIIAIVQALGLEITEVVDPNELNPPVQTCDEINWHEVCGKVLAQQQEFQRLRRQATERGFELNVYVPLGLVERKQQQRRRGDVPLEEVYQLTEEVITKEYDNDKFLTEVIEPGRSRRIAIIGEPGAGKTTLQEKIAVWIHDKNKGLPICIPLGGLQGKSLEDYLLQIWLKTALRFIEPDASGVEAQAFASLQKLFREGKVWLLLDGVDEMAATSPVEALATIKEQLTDWLAEARVVLTCRLNVWDANVNTMLTGFETYRTLEFKPEQVEDFIRQWFACAEESQRGEELLRKLQETGKERIRELVRNPLRLSLLCQTSYLLPVDEPLPETKAALYERFTRYFYEWKQELHLDLTAQHELIDELHEALGKLALAGINSATRFRLERKFARQEMGERLFKLAARLNWLVLVDREANTDEAVYAFFHPTFQEYFAACAIDDWRFFLNHDNENPNPLLNPNPSLEYDNGKPAYRIFEPQWKEIILLWLGREVNEEFKNQKEAFIGALLEFKDCCQKLYSRRAYFLAALGIAEFSKHSGAHKIVNTVAMVGCGCFDVEESIVESARIVLLKTDRKLAIEILLDLVKKWEPALWNAAEILSKIGVHYPKVITTLFELIPQIKNESLRKVVANAVMGFDSINLEIQDLGKQTLILVDQEEEQLNFILTQEDINFFDQIWTYSDYVLQLVKTNPYQDETISEVINILDYCPCKNHSEGLTILDINEAIVNNISHRNLLLILVKLRKLLLSEKLNKSTESYNYYYEILWNYAQKIPYPQFYQAWQPDNHS
jgi:hypothetical protein